MKKKFLSVLLSLTLCITMVPAISFADQTQSEDAEQSCINSKEAKTEAPTSQDFEKATQKSAETKQKSETNTSESKTSKQKSVGQSKAAKGVELLSGDSDQKDSSVVKLTHGSKISYYDAWINAYTDASNGDTLTLLKDINSELQLKKALTINLGGYNLTGNTYVASNSSITFEGEGTLNYLKVHSTSESCSLTVPAGNDKLEIKELVVGVFTSINLSSGKYGSISAQGAPMDSSMDKLLDLLADGYSFVRLNPDWFEPDLINVYDSKSASNVKVVDHSKHEYSSAESEFKSPGQCYCGYWCQHECGPYGDGGCADCFLLLMASVTDDAGHTSYYTEFDTAIEAALDKGINKITALLHSQQFSGPEPINLKNLGAESFTLEFEQIAYLPETTVTIDSPGTSVVITGGGGCGKVLVKNCDEATFSDVCIGQLEVFDSSVAQNMTFWGEINEKISLPEGCRVKDLLPDLGYGCKNLADGVTDPWNSINLGTNVIEGNFAIKPIPITSMSITPAETQIEIGRNVDLEVNVSLADDDYSVDEYKWYEVKGQKEELITTTDSNTLNTGSSLAVGSHTIRCKATRDGYVKSADCVVNVTKKSYVEGDDFTAPVGASGLTYTGKEQPLVSAPTKVPNGARVQYHVGENTWQDEIPTAKDAGNYSVYWKIVGNDTYSDYYEDSPISVSISQADAGRPKTGVLRITQYVANTYEYDVKKLLPGLIVEGTSYGDVQYSIESVNLASGYYDASKAAVQVNSEGVLSLPIQENKNTQTGKVGEVVVTAKAKNYGTIRLQVDVNAYKLALNFELTGPCEKESTETFDVGAKLPSDAQITSVEVGASSILSTCSPTFAAGGKTCTIKATSRVFDEPQSTNLPITVKTSNYGIITGTMKITLTGKYIVNIAACPQDALYDGGSHSGYSGTVSASLKTGGEPYEGNDLTYTYAKADGSIIEGAPSEVGDYTLTIAVPESNETCKGSTEIKFSIVSEAEVLYQTEADGEWQGSTFDEALIDVYDGGTIKLLKDVARAQYADLVRPVTITSNNPSAPCKIYAKADQHGYLLNVDTGASAQRAVDGGVKLENVIVDGGSQNGLTAKRAAIAVNSGHLTLGSGAVVQNNANVSQRDDSQSGVGGGIYIDKGTLVIDSGLIADNTANNGGGVFVANGTFVMKGGAIKSNTAQHGGGVFVNNNSSTNSHTTFKLSGGSISNNTALNYAGGVICAPGSEVRLSGSPFITNNTSGEEECGGIYLNGDGGADADVIIEGALTEQARISFFAWKEKNNFIVAVPGNNYTITSSDMNQLHYAGQIFALKLNDVGNVVLYEADFVVVAKAYGSGSISPSGKMGVFKGEHVKFTITPDEGFVIKDVTVDGQSVGAVKSYVLENIQKSSEVSAFFEEAPSGGDEGNDGDDDNSSNNGEDGSDNGNSEDSGKDDSTTPSDGSSDSSQQASALSSKDVVSKGHVGSAAKTGDALGIAVVVIASIAVVAAGVILLARKHGKK